VVLILSVLPMFSSHDAALPPGVQVPRGRGVNAADLMGQAGMERFNLPRRNPEIGFLERIFCLGLSKSVGCGNQAYHPYLTWWKNFSDSDVVDPKTRGNAVKVIVTTFQTVQKPNEYKRRKEILYADSIGNE